jgi:hypothetical protein
MKPISHLKDGCNVLFLETGLGITSVGKDVETGDLRIAGGHTVEGRGQLLRGTVQQLLKKLKIGQVPVAQ